MNLLRTNPPELVALMVADHLKCDTLTLPEIEDLLMLIHRCVFDRQYDALGRYCAQALVAQLRGQLLTRKHIAIAKGQS